MLSSQGQAASITTLLDPVSAANTAAATSGWIDVRALEGDLHITAQVGALTGSITWTLQDATDGTGTGAAAIVPEDGAFTAGAANQSQHRNVNASACRGWIQIIGTIVTGPALVAATVQGHPKYTT